MYVPNGLSEVDLAIVETFFCTSHGRPYFLSTMPDLDKAIGAVLKISPGHPSTLELLKEVHRAIHDDSLPDSASVPCVTD